MRWELRKKPPSIAGSEGDYTAEEFEFIRAMEAYMQRNRVRFPSFTQVLAVAKSLGYRRTVEGPIIKRDGDAVVIDIPLEHSECPKAQALIHALTQ